jgi:hypothetical protein
MQGLVELAVARSVSRTRTVWPLVIPLFSCAAIPHFTSHFSERPG